MLFAFSHSFEDAVAQQIDFLSYQGQADLSELVIIAKPTASHDTEESGQIADPFHTGMVLNAIGRETNLMVVAVLKGDRSLKECVLFTLHAGKPETEHKTDLVMHDEYLFFLTRDGYNRYVPTGRQGIPRITAIKHLD